MFVCPKICESKGMQVMERNSIFELCFRTKDITVCIFVWPSLVTSCGKAYIKITEPYKEM